MCARAKLMSNPSHDTPCTDTAPGKGKVCASDVSAARRRRRAGGDCADDNVCGDSLLRQTCQTTCSAEVECQVCPYTDETSCASNVQCVWKDDACKTACHAD